jgi:sugar/nucleoside kinase (ribokinase family)
MAIKGLFELSHHDELQSENLDTSLEDTEEADVVVDVVVVVVVACTATLAADIDDDDHRLFVINATGVDKEVKRKDR